MRILLSPLLIICCLMASGQIGQKIQGSWELKSYINHDEGSSEWGTYGGEILFQKHISGNHFTWIKFNTQTKTLLGMGGGSYEIDKMGRYVENLDFFYPPGSSELGQAIPFTVAFKGKNWLHSGYVKVMDIDLVGSSNMVDSAKIEEIWKPIPAKNKMTDLVGAWELVRYQENKQGYMVYPKIIGYMKIITGSHFVWIKYDQEGDQIFAAGSGSYKREVGKYVEDIEMMYPDPGLIGRSIDFDCSINGNLWKHYGILKNDDGTSGAIDEFWSPKKIIKNTSIFD